MTARSATPGMRSSTEAITPEPWQALRCCPSSAALPLLCPRSISALHRSSPVISDVCGILAPAGVILSVVRFYWFCSRRHQGAFVRKIRSLPELYSCPGRAYPRSCDAFIRKENIGSGRITVIFSLPEFVLFFAWELCRNTA